jgi:hypothetical protein
MEPPPSMIEPGMIEPGMIEKGRQAAE